ncbi:metallophosphoesterase [Mucilaginibacter sp. HMF5004]|uniref:metallophosphoesterase family protein n=1 Tax=Mucilaginibacter rivuli TaxID=2857527 RepID=UPI001C5F683C|nr:metallophosphoesterase [Mucilaginibacter rivuli]MBW4891473.1 metallophosphoesterase [Mucilaginibacter rivuli]
MSNRRKFITNTLTGLAGITLLPAVNTFAATVSNPVPNAPKKLKLRFALCSDLHYAQPGTDFDLNAANLVKWMNDEHDQNHLDRVIINGDLVHNRPDLLPVLKEKYFDKIAVPYHTVPGNHDFADGAIWKKVFGYDDKYVVEHGDIAFVFANTADTKGVYVSPDNDFLKASFDKLTNKKMIFVILHIAPVQWLKEEASVFLNCPDTVKLLHSYPNIKAVFHGHDHSLDGVRYTDKLPHFFDSHTGGNWGTDYKGYRIVEVGDDNAVYTYQVNASRNPNLNANKF